MAGAILQEDPHLALAVLARMEEGVLIHDDAYRIVDANPAACTLLGRGHADLLGTALADVVAPEDRGTLAAAWPGVLETGEGRCAVRVEPPEGPAREVECASFAHVLPGRHVSILRDVTGARANERHLEAARRQLAQTEKLSALGTLTSGVAHEIRTPLTFIASHLYVIRSKLDRAAAEGRVDEAVLRSLREHFHEAGVGVDRINQLVLELRRFARLQPGQKAPARLEEVVRDAVRLFQATARGRQALRLRLEPVPPMPLDAGQIQQVVLNLLENAADAQPNGGVVSLQVRALPDGGEVSVEDEGGGIPPEVEARMFEAFYTTKHEGMGLGLSIVKRIVEAHGGRVTYATAPGKGTRFAFTLRRPPG